MKIEPIISITELEGDSGRYNGWEVKTARYTYKVKINNRQRCCESWGYFSTPDDVQFFVGATLMDVKIVDAVLNVKSLEQRENEWSWTVEEEACMFVNFDTTRGVLQLAVYNMHNGYYGHRVIIDIGQEDDDEKEFYL